MAIDRLPNLPAGTDIFLDANVFIYALGGHSNDCHQLLRRCATEEIFGITTLDVINEVTHRLMLTEAVAKHVIPKGNASALKGKWRDVATLTEYWLLASRIFALAPGSGMTIDLFIDRPALSTHQSQNVTFIFSQLRKCENMKNRSDSVGEID